MTREEREGKKVSEEEERGGEEREKKSVEQKRGWEEGRVVGRRKMEGGVDVDRIKMHCNNQHSIHHKPIQKNIKIT
jgi:hypothetical protein